MNINPLVEVFGLIGFSLTVSVGLITEGLRFWLIKKGKVLSFLGSFLSCSMCVGFWLGNFYSFIFRNKTIVEDFLYGAMIGLFAYSTDIILSFLKSRYELLWKEDSITRSSAKAGESEEIHSDSEKG